MVPLIHAPSYMVAELWIADQAECHDDMADYMQSVGAQPAKLLVDEWDPRSVADKNAVGSRRAARRVVTSVEQKEKTKGREQQADDARECTFALDDYDELIPEWLNSVKGFKDSEELPLNIYRENLLQNKIVRVIKKNQVKKYLVMLAEIAEQKGDYKMFREQFGGCLKLGTREDSTIGVKSAEVLRFNTSKSKDEHISLKGYVDRMKEGQNDIWHITGESIDVVSSSPFLENLRNKGYEVSYMADPVDECAVHKFKEFGGKMLKCTTEEELDLGDDDEKNKIEELKAEFKPLTKLIKEVLGDNGEMVIASDRIVDSPCVPSTSEYGWSAEMERIVEAQALRDSSAELTMKAQVPLDSGSQRMQLASGSQQKRERREEMSEKAEGGEWETVVGKRRKKGESDQERRKKGKEREAEEGGSEQVKNDVMDWTVVSRSKKRNKMIQIYVRVNGGKLVPMEVNLKDDKVEDVMRQIPSSEDMYVMMHGRVLKRNEMLKSCGVTDGCTIQVASRMRGGGRHKNKMAGERKKKSPKKVEQDDQNTKEENLPEDAIAEMFDGGSRTGVGGLSAEVMEAMVGMEDVKGDKGPAIRECDKDAVIRMTEQNQVYRKFIEGLSAVSDFEAEWMLQEYLRQCRETMGWTQEQAEMMECGIRWAVEARRKGRGEEKEQEQRRREEPLEEMRTESTDEPEVTSRVVEVKTGRGSASLVQGGVDGHDELDETRGKGKGKGNGGKGEHGGKGDKGGKGFQQSTRTRKGEEELRSEENGTQKELIDEEEQEAVKEDDRVQVAPNTGAGGSHPRVTTDPEEEGQEEEVEEAEERQCRGGKRSQAGEWTLRPAREWRKWADCVDEEPEEEAGEEDEQEAEDEREEKKAEEQGRRTEEAGGRSREEHVTEEEAEERECRGSEGREEEVKGEEEAGRGEEIVEKPPGLEEVKSKLKVQEEEKQSQVGSEQEVQEAREDEERRTQKAREEERRAQEAREDEERRVQEAREEQQRRAREAREEEEQRRAREARAAEKKAEEAREARRSEEKRGEARRSEEKRGEARRSEEKRGEARRSEEGAKEERREERRLETREKEVEAQEKQRREVRREERGSEERDVEPQGGQGEEGDRVDAQGGRGRKEEETNDENSLHEESHASDRYMTWWRNAWWVRVNNGPHMRTARGRRKIWRAARQAAEQACQEERAGEAQGEEGERKGGRKETQQQQKQQRRQEQQEQQHGGATEITIVIRPPVTTTCSTRFS